MKKMEEKEKKEIAECAIRILSTFPAEISTRVILKILATVLGIIIAGSAKDIYKDEMYKNLSDAIKDMAQCKEAREILTVYLERCNMKEIGELTYD